MKSSVIAHVAVQRYSVWGVERSGRQTDERGFVERQVLQAHDRVEEHSQLCEPAKEVET